MAVKLGYKRTEVGTVPEEWDVRPLKYLAAISHGFGFQSRYFTDSGKYRLTTPGNFHEGGGFRDSGEKQKYYTGPVPDGYLLNEGDLIVAMTEQAEGLLGSAALVPLAGSYLHNQRLGKVRPLSSDVSVGFLYRIFNSAPYRARVRETAAGTKVKHTSPSRLLEIFVPIPPTRLEQDAVADALSDADALVESWEQTLSKKRLLKKAALQELLTGKVRLPGFTGDWPSVAFGSLYERVFDRSPLSSGDGGETGDYPLFISGGAPKWTDTALYRATEALIFSDGGVFSVRYFSGDFSVTDHCYTLTLRSEKASMAFLAAWFTLNERTLDRLTFKGSGLRNMSKAALGAIEVPQPELVEQTAIAAVLSDLDAELAVVEAKLAKARALRQGMMQDLLTGRIRLV